jgi:hypothetical protein
LLRVWLRTQDSVIEMRLANSVESIFSNSDSVEMAGVIELGWVDMESSHAFSMRDANPSRDFEQQPASRSSYNLFLGDCPELESSIRDDADISTIRVWHGGSEPTTAVLGWSSLYGTGDFQPT